MAPCLDGGVQIDVYRVLELVVVIDQRSAVHKTRHAQRSVGVDDRPMQNKAARPQHGRRADNRRRMDHARHMVSGLQQTARPREAQAVVAKSRDGLVVSVSQRRIIHTLANDPLAAHRVV